MLRLQNVKPPFPFFFKLKLHHVIILGHYMLLFSLPSPASSFGSDALTQQPLQSSMALCQRPAKPAAGGWKRGSTGSSARRC